MHSIVELSAPQSKALASFWHNLSACPKCQPKFFTTGNQSHSPMAPKNKNNCDSVSRQLLYKEHMLQHTVMVLITNG